MEPIFETDGVMDDGNAQIVRDKHLKLKIYNPEDRSNPFDCIAFNQKDKMSIVSQNKPFNILYHVEENRWNNVTSTQLNIKDVESMDNDTTDTPPQQEQDSSPEDFTYRTSSDK